MTSLTSHLDIFAAETADHSEWHLMGWAFVPHDQIWSGSMEVDEIPVGPLSCGWSRPDVPLAFPGQCPSEHVGFRAQIFLPSGLPAGEHRLTLIFANKTGRELGRMERIFSTGTACGTSIAVTPPHIDPTQPQAAYLDLLEKTLLGLPYVEGLQTLERLEGQGWSETAHSMIGAARMRHLRACVETVLRERVPGDCIETGVWRGGACILMRGVLKACGDTTRTVWVADSFAGLPPPNEHKYPADRGDTLHECQELAIPLGQVQENFRQYDLLDAHVRFLKGWFSKTLPDAEVSQIAVLRLDGDMYESTMDALTHLYPKLSPGGYCIIDDYGAIAACRQAVRDYRAAHGIDEPVTMIDWTGAFWRKGSAPGRDETSVTEGSNGAPPAPVSQHEAAYSALEHLFPALADVRTGHPTGAWTEHIPFAFWLVDQLRPRVIVELGVHTGGSYLAFCQAVTQSRVNARCYGIDTFQGDDHAGHYTSSVLEHLRAYHDPRYRSFSILIQSTFHEALAHFEDGSIDLLHIDGLHHYENVKEDFETWLPKLSRRAIVLFHDTQVRERGFGVYRFWAEMERQYPSIEFYHGFGLGVLAVGRDVSPSVSGLLFIDEERRAFARRFFSTLGSRLAQRMGTDAPPVSMELLMELASQRDSLEAQQRLAQQTFVEVAERLEQTQAELKTLHLAKPTLHQEQLALRSRLLARQQPPATATSHGAVKLAKLHLWYRCLTAAPFLKKKSLRAQQKLVEVSGLFDEAFYQSQLPPGQRATDASLHYLLIGWRAGLSPHPQFDAPWYIHTYQESLKEREPLTDYLVKGWKKYRSPNPDFDPKWYHDTYLKKSRKEVPPFRHYLETGLSRGNKPNATAQ